MFSIHTSWCPWYSWENLSHKRRVPHEDSGVYSCFRCCYLGWCFMFSQYADMSLLCIIIWFLSIGDLSSLFPVIMRWDSCGSLITNVCSSSFGYLSRKSVDFFPKTSTSLYPLPLCAFFYGPLFYPLFIVSSGDCAVQFVTFRFRDRFQLYGMTPAQCMCTPVAWANTSGTFERSCISKRQNKKLDSVSCKCDSTHSNGKNTYKTCIMAQFTYARWWTQVWATTLAWRCKQVKLR